MICIYIGLPGGLIGGPRAYQDQFRRFKSHRVHAGRGVFLHKKMISGKRESVSYLLSMKIDGQVGMLNEPFARQKIKAKGRHL